MGGDIQPLFLALPGQGRRCMTWDRGLRVVSREGFHQQPDE